MAVQQNEMVQGGYMTVGGAPEVICTGQVLEMLTQNWKRSSVRHIHEKRCLSGDQTALPSQYLQLFWLNLTNLIRAGLSSLDGLDDLGYALVFIDLPWSAWAVSDHHRKA